MNRELNIAGKKIFYRVHGKGKPVTLVHGFGETGDVWSNQVEFLKEKFLLIVPDLPGSGQSEMIDDMSVEGMAEVLKHILDKELTGRSDMALIGHSMGGYVTLAFAEKYESRLRSFGLFQSTALPDSEEKKNTRRKGIEFIREHGGFEFLKMSTPNLFSPQTKEHDAGLVSRFIESLRGFSGEALISYYESMINRPGRVALLEKTKLPVLFVIGEHDTAVAMNDGLEQSHLPDRAYIHVLHESGHMGMMEEVEKSNRLLEEFLSEV